MRALLTLFSLCTLVVFSALPASSSTSLKQNEDNKNPRKETILPGLNVDFKTDNENPNPETPIDLEGGPDQYGHYFMDSQQDGFVDFDWIDISETGTPITNWTDDTTLGPFQLAFPFTFYGEEYDEFWVCSNGWISFLPNQGNRFSNHELPNTLTPNCAIFWFWDDLNPSVGDMAQTYYGLDESGNFVIQFVDWNEFGAQGNTLTAEVILSPVGTIKLQYLNFNGNISITSETIGIENQDGTDGLMASYGTTPANYPYEELAILFHFGIGDANISGTVIDAGEDIPLEGAVISVGIWTDTTDAQGFYSIEGLMPLTYSLLAQAEGCYSLELPDIFLPGGDTVINFGMGDPPVLNISPTSLELFVPANSYAEEMVQISNYGESTLAYSITAQSTDSLQLVSIIPSSGRIDFNETAEILVIAADSGIPAGNYLVNLQISSNDPQIPTWNVPLEVILGVSQPDPFSLLAPENGATIDDTQVFLAWEASVEHDENDAITYSVYVSEDSDQQGMPVVSGLSDTTWLFEGEMDRIYFWTVHAVDLNSGGRWAEEQWNFSFTIPAPPSEFDLAIPEDGHVFDNSGPSPFMISWTQSDDPNPADTVRYDASFHLVADGMLDITHSIEGLTHNTHTINLLDSVGLQFWGSDLTVEWSVNAIAGQDTTSCCEPFTFTFLEFSDVRSLSQPEIPVVYSIQSAYPNPFNATTRITLALPEPSSIRMSVFDLLGREVSRLAEGPYGAGYHTVDWKATVGSGIYFLKVSNGQGWTEARKLYLVK